MNWLLLLGGLGLASAASGEELRDPMRPPLAEVRSAASVQEAAPVLSAVLNFNGQRMAIFNGHLVRSGSSLGAFTIEAVLEDGVRYRHAGLTQVLHMAHTVPTLKQPAALVARAPSGVQ
jgi:hypothetical protein